MLAYFHSGKILLSYPYKLFSSNPCFGFSQPSFFNEYIIDLKAGISILNAIFRFVPVMHLIQFYNKNEIYIRKIKIDR